MPPASPVDSPPAARRIAQELLQRFSLGPPLHLEVAPGGLLNQNLFAVTARGAYFLKGYRYPDPEPIRREHALIAFAAEQGSPALLPISDPAGKTFLRVGGRWWAVFPRLAAPQLSPEDLTPHHAFQMGRALGQLHVALSALPATDAARFPLRLTWSSAAAHAEMAGYELTIGKRPYLDPFDQHTLSTFGYRRTLLASGVPSPETFASLPSQVLHGDYHHGNLFFTPDGAVSHVVDWELACFGPRAWEIIRALDVSLRFAEDLEQGGDRLRGFIHGYAAAALLSAEECDAMPDLYWAARVHSLWVYEEHYRKGAAKTDRVAMQDLELLHWLAAHRTRLAAALRQALSTAPAMKLAS